MLQCVGQDIASEFVIGLQGIPSHEFDLSCEHVHLYGDMSKLIWELFELCKCLGKHDHSLTAIPCGNIDFSQYNQRFEFVFVQTVLGAEFGHVMDRCQRFGVIFLFE